MTHRWTVKWLPEAVQDLEALDRSVRVRILKAVWKLRRDPSIGAPLGEKHNLNLTGFRKLEPGAYRVVYQVYENHVMVLVVAVGKREKEYVYRLAGERARELRRKTDEELEAISNILKEFSLGR
ncbi:MAG: type II toxin-antitoxin system RelE/ParE family toxin [Bacillota bacterium]|nr:type II toxin-antitoxin system RelE/ParE family toxin [Bacillota bacterium]